jgi:hypothetical protein
VENACNPTWIDESSVVQPNLITTVGAEHADL